MVDGKRLCKGLINVSSKAWDTVGGKRGVRIGMWMGRRLGDT